MRQPKPQPATEDIAEWLHLAVPLCSIDLADRAEQHFGSNKAMAERWLLSIAKRGTDGLNRGDALSYPARETPGRRATATAAQQVAEAVAAAGLLAGPRGITVWGAHFCPVHPCPHADEALLPTEPASTVERELRDVIRDLADYLTEGEAA